MNNVHLTAKEKKVLHLIVEGCGDKEIATSLSMSFGTVRMPNLINPDRQSGRIRPAIS